MALQQAQYPIGAAYAMADANRNHSLLVSNSARYWVTICKIRPAQLYRPT